MANNQNLIPNNKRSPSEVRENGKKGGIKSGKVRRARKSFKEGCLDKLSDGITQDEIINALIEKAKKGDTKAFEIIRDTIGEKPIDKQEIKEVTSEWFK